MVPFFKLVRNLFFFSVTVGAMVFCIYAHAAETPAAPNPATLTAKLIDPEAKAAKQSATVAVVVTGLQLTDPGSVGEKPAAGQGHLHYQVDKGFIIATTATKLSFHGLTPGTHTIMVSLAANDHSPLGPSETLTVTVPAAASAKPAPAAAPKPEPAPKPAHESSGGY